MSNDREQLHTLLRERRKTLDISLAELSHKTAIPQKHLRRIERGEWERLPSAVYTKGFLRKYARSVGYNPEEVVRAYTTVSRTGDESVAATRTKKILQFLQNISFSPALARIVGIVVVLTGILGYAGYQLSAVVAHPDITLSRPAQQELVVEDDSVVIAGRVEPGTEVFLNLQSLSVRSNGTFKETVDLLPGINTFDITAVSRFGKETTVERRIIYTPQAE